MTKLSTEEFFMRAIKNLPPEPDGHSEFRHLGVRLELLKDPFARHYGPKKDLAETLNALIENETVVAVHLTWHEGEIQKAMRLRSFPDPAQEEENPILYLPKMVPKDVRLALRRSIDALDKILSG
jgi:hypothetical protein